MALIIGCGTGRCGTLSLSYLINGCKNAWVTHEDVPILPWKKHDGRYQDFQNNMLKRKKQAPDCKYVGDVALYYLNYIESILEDFNAKVIILQRDKEKVVNSFVRRTKGHNHFKKGENTHPFDKCFPNYDNLAPRRRFEEYWDEYKYRALNLESRFPNMVKIFKTETMNTKEGQDEIFDFIGIEKEDRVYMEDTYHNVFLDQK